MAMRVGELWQKVDRYLAKLPARPDGKRPTLSALLKSRPPADISSTIESLTQAFKNRRSSDRNPSLAQLEAFVKNHKHLTLVDLSGAVSQAPPADAVAEYTARIKRVFGGNGRGFFDIMKELDADDRIKVGDMRAIVSAVLGGSVSKLSRKAAKATLVAEFATLEVGRVSTEAAIRSRPY
jgi:hypothetical protein